MASDHNFYNDCQKDSNFRQRYMSQCQEISKKVPTDIRLDTVASVLDTHTNLDTVLFLVGLGLSLYVLDSFIGYFWKPDSKCRD